MTTYMTTQTIGTVRWQAPELIPDIQGPDVTDLRNTMATDVYAYGLVCHEVNRVLGMPCGYVTE
jgi:serine/threonine protein kinase